MELHPRHPGEVGPEGCPKSYAEGSDGLAGAFLSMFFKAGESRGIDDLAVVPERSSADFSVDGKPGDDREVVAQGHVDDLPVPFPFPEYCSADRLFEVVAVDVGPVHDYRQPVGRPEVQPHAELGTGLGTEWGFVSQARPAAMHSGLDILGCDGSGHQDAGNEQREESVQKSMPKVSRTHRSSIAWAGSAELLSAGTPLIIGLHMSKRVCAVYPGSFDPVTNGHLDIIERACTIFDRVIVAVTRNIEKEPLFSLQERLEMLQSVTRSWKNIEVDSFEGLLVQYARNKGASAVIRGIRAVTDFDYEFQMALMNRRLEPRLETVFLVPAEAYSYLSSSLVKEVAALGGDVGGLVPVEIGKRVYARLAANQASQAVDRESESE